MCAKKKTAQDQKSEVGSPRSWDKPKKEKKKKTIQ